MNPLFDFSAIPVPFAMRPGLRRMVDLESAVTAADAQSAAEKRSAWASAQCPLQAAPGAEADAGIAHALHWFHAFATKNIAIKRHGTPAIGTFPSRVAFQSLSDGISEDFAVIDGRTADGRIPWLCVALPSHWAPEEKVGLSFPQIHAPVADNALLQSASAGLVTLATSGEAWERSVWTLASDLRLDQHPVRQVRSPWVAAALDGSVDSLQHIGWRWERQCIVPVPALDGLDESRGLAIFTIRVFTQPLLEALEQSSAPAAHARKLAQSLESMSDAVLAYKSLQTVCKPAVAALRAYAASA
jgi:dimethylamine monooxygenase subunit A